MRPVVTAAEMRPPAPATPGAPGLRGAAHMETPGRAIDALSGTGLGRAIEGHLADVVAVVNHAGARLAVDIPSGLDADTGRALGVSVSAQRTVTMGALKIAHASAPGFARCGDVDVV